MKQMTLKTLAALFAVTAPLAFAPVASATTDANDRVYLIVANINSEDAEGHIEYDIERAPIIGCYGLAQGARLAAWTTVYYATQNVGCGGKPMYDDINALSCAKIVDSKESEDYMSFSEVTLDISKCADKKNPQFIKAIEVSAKKNFPQSNKKKSVVLKLIK